MPRKSNKVVYVKKTNNRDIEKFKLKGRPVINKSSLIILGNDGSAGGATGKLADDMYNRIKNLTKIES